MNHVRLLCFGVLAFALEGCLSDCAVQEATGSLAKFAATGCSSSGTLQAGNGVQLHVDMRAESEELMNELEFDIPGPMVIGLRGSGIVTAKYSVDFFSSFGRGVVDYVVTGVRPKEGTRDVTVDVDLACPRISTVFGEGSFKGHASVLVFDL